MSGRVVPFGVALLLSGGLLGAIVASCYDVPEPDCGFLCGPNAACPADYTCAADHHCHRAGTPDTLVCGTPDAAVDAPPDTPPADAASDATADALTDAVTDTVTDAPAD